MTLVLPGKIHQLAAIARSVHVWIAVLPLSACGIDALVMLFFEVCRPLNEVVLSFLMPQFTIASFSVVANGLHLQIVCDLVNHRYLTVGGNVVEPGYAFSAATPARNGIFLPTLMASGVILTTRMNVRPPFVWWLAAVLLLTSVELLAVPLVLAGVIWDLTLGEAGQFAAESMLAWASKFMVHGGGFFLVVAGVVLLSRLAQTKQRLPSVAA